MHLLFCLLALSLAAADKPVEPRPVLEQALDVATVWAGHPVGFYLLTHQEHQYVAFYDADRHMTVAARKLAEPRWTCARLPSQIGWDSHNYIVMAIDDTGRIHLSGNMHGSKLIYFRTERPNDITTFRQIPAMVGTQENRVTYPRFFPGPRGELMFTYRDGGSGDGNQIYNRYDATTQRWHRLLDEPLIDGQGEMNAYLDPMQRDRQGVFHMCWVWRDTPDCATNHDVCYARSRDLLHWEKSDGTPLTLPITYATNEIVEPIPPGNGLINGNARLGFDEQDRPVVSYIKYDAQGKTQAYNARIEGGQWRSRQVSDWDYRWEFAGGGSINFEIIIGPVQRDPAGRLVQTFSHPKAGSGRWLLDPQTLTPRATLPAEQLVPAESARVESDFPGMQVRWAADAGQPDSPDVYYRLRWETLGPNRDGPRTGPLPQPATLRLLKLRRAP